MHSRIVLFAVLLAAMVAVAWAIGVVAGPAPTPRGGPPAVPSGPASDATSDATSHATPAARGETLAEPPQRSAGTEAAAFTVPESMAYRFERPAVPVSGIVRDALRQPVPGASVALQPVAGGRHALAAIAADRQPLLATVTDPFGRFAFGRVAVGAWLATASAPDGRAARRTIAVAAAAASETIALELDPDIAGAQLRVRVQDGDGRSVAGARVELRTPPPDAGVVTADGPAESAAVTDADGAAAFAATSPGPLVVSASAVAGDAWVVLMGADYEPRTSAVVLTLAPSGSLVGELTGVPVERLRGASVQALAISHPNCAYYTCVGASRTAVVDGSTFTFAALPPGNYSLHLESPLGLRFVLPPVRDVANSVDPLVVTVRPGERSEVRAEVAAGGRIECAVQLADGTPVAGALATAVLVPLSPNFPDGFEIDGAVVWRLDGGTSEAHVHPAAHRTARTAANGRCVLDALPPGRYRLELFAAGLAFEQRSGIDVSADGAVQLAFELVPAGALMGVLAGGSYFGVRRVGSSRYDQLAILPQHGAFTFTGLVPGDYEVGKPSPFGAGFVRLARARVEAGRVTWLDLHNVGPVRIAGVLRDTRGTPVQADLRLWDARTPSGVDGAFELHLPWPVRGGTEQTIEVRAAGLTWRLPLPADALGATDWFGEFVLPAERLVVQLADSDGTPLAGMVELTGGIVHGVVPIGAEGTVELRYLEPGTYQLHATVRDAIVPVATAVVPAVEPVRLRATASTMLDVLALDAAGRPRERAPVQYALWTGPPPAPRDPAAIPGPWSTTQTGPDGHVRFAVPVGELVLYTFVWDHDERNAIEVVHAVRGQPLTTTLRLPR